MVSDGLWMGLLGPFEVRLEGVLVGPGGARRRGLLAVLAAEPNVVQPVASVIDRLWGEAPPASAVNVVQTYVSAWRKVLGGADGPLATVGGGYRLALSTEHSDLLSLPVPGHEGSYPAGPGRSRLLARRPRPLARAGARGPGRRGVPRRARRAPGGRACACCRAVGGSRTGCRPRPRRRARPAAGGPGARSAAGEHDGHGVEGARARRAAGVGPGGVRRGPSAARRRARHDPGSCASGHASADPPGGPRSAAGPRDRPTGHVRPRFDVPGLGTRRPLLRPRRGAGRRGSAVGGRSPRHADRPWRQWQDAAGPRGARQAPGAGWARMVRGAGTGA